MTAPAQATPDDVARYAAAFASTPWPLARTDLRHIGEELGWALRTERPRSIVFRSGLPLDLDGVHSLLDGDDVNQVTIDLTDDAPASVVRAIAAEMAAAVQAELGTPTGTKPVPRSVYWDLPSGARIAVKDLGEAVILDVLSPRYARTERDEERLGVDPTSLATTDQD